MAVVLREDLLSVEKLMKRALDPMNILVEQVDKFQEKGLICDSKSDKLWPLGVS